MMILGRTTEDTLMNYHSVISIYECLKFMIIFKKPVLIANLETKYFGMVINSRDDFCLYAKRWRIYERNVSRGIREQKFCK